MKKHLGILGLIFVSPALFLTSFAQGIGQQPCADYQGKPIPEGNQTVIGYKTTLPNLMKKQVYVKGTLVKYMGPIHNQHGTHLHFIMNLGNQTDTMATMIEISHSMNGMTSNDYPTENDLKAGPIFICGEYSTTNVNGTPKITKFTPSATGAMIHWTHRADSEGGHQSHPHGWIMANGKVFGNDPGRDRASH